MSIYSMYKVHEDSFRSPKERDSDAREKLRGVILHKMESHMENVVNLVAQKGRPCSQ